MSSPARVDYIRSTQHDFLSASEEALANPQLQIILAQLAQTLGEKNQRAWPAMSVSPEPSWRLPKQDLYGFMRSPVRKD